MSWYGKQSKYNNLRGLALLAAAVKRYTYPNNSTPKSYGRSGAAVRLPTTRTITKTVTKKKRTRRNYKRPARYVQKFVKKQIRNSELDRNVNVYRDSYGLSYTVGINSCAYFHHVFGSRDDLQSVVSNGQVAYFNSAASGDRTAQAADPSEATTIISQFRIINIKQVYHIRNNCTHPIWLETFKFKCTRSTNSSVTGLFGASVNQKKGLASSDTDYLTEREWNLYDANNYLSKYWKQYYHRKILMSPGDEIIMNCTVTRPRYWGGNDNEQQQYMKGFTRTVVFRLEGGVVHDSVSPSEVGTADGTLDVVKDRHHRYLCDAGDKMKFIKSNMTNMGTISTAYATIDDVDEDQDA